MRDQNAMYCYRPNGTCYAVISSSEWKALRKAGTLDADLKRRRDSGAIIEVTRPESAKPAVHFKPREGTEILRGPAPDVTILTDPKSREYVSVVTWCDGLSYPGGDPENGPARRVPANGCRECGSTGAESYDETGLGAGCCQFDDAR